MFIPILESIKLSPTTPEKSSLSVKLFIKKIGFPAKPIYLPFEYRPDSYKVGCCFSNCESESLISGSRIVFGWIVWHDKKNLFHETEFHAVICENNKMIDITPRKDGEDLVLFIPDQLRKAVRIDENIWDTWSAFKMFRGKITDVSRPIRRIVVGNIVNK